MVSCRPIYQSVDRHAHDGWDRVDTVRTRHVDAQQAALDPEPPDEHDDDLFFLADYLYDDEQGRAQPQPAPVTVMKWVDFFIAVGALILQFTSN